MGFRPKRQDSEPTEVVKQKTSLVPCQNSSRCAAQFEKVYGILGNQGPNAIRSLKFVGELFCTGLHKDYFIQKAFPTGSIFAIKHS